MFTLRPVVTMSLNYCLATPLDKISRIPSPCYERLPSEKYQSDREGESFYFLQVMRGCREKQTLLKVCKSILFLRIIKASNINFKAFVSFSLRIGPRIGFSFPPSSTIGSNNVESSLFSHSPTFIYIKNLYSRI